MLIYAYGNVGKTRWVYLSTSHHIEPEPLGEGLMWRRVLTSAYIAVPNDAVTLTTSQGSDTVTSIFKYNSSNTIKSLRLLKMT